MFIYELHAFLIKSFRALLILPTGRNFLFLIQHYMIKVHQHALINLVYSYMVCLTFNPFIFISIIYHLLWFKKQSFTLVWKPNPPVCWALFRLRAPSRSDAVSTTHKALALKLHLFTWSVKSDSCYNVLWLCSVQTQTCTSATTSIFWGVMRLTAKPRYLLLLHRGKEKSNTVTALICRRVFSVFVAWCCVLSVCLVLCSQCLFGAVFSVFVWCCVLSLWCCVFSVCLLLCSQACWSTDARAVLLFTVSIRAFWRDCSRHRMPGWNSSWSKVMFERSVWWPECWPNTPDPWRLWSTSCSQAWGVSCPRPIPIPRRQPCRAAIMKPESRSRLKDLDASLHSSSWGFLRVIIQQPWTVF